MKLKKSLTYDDIQIIPKYSEINHRTECNLSTRITKNKFLRAPIVSSPMDSVTEGDMVYTMWNFGGLGFVHRFMSIEEQCNIIKTVCDKITYEEQPLKNLEISDELKNWFSDPPLGAAVGVSKDYIERSQELIESGVNILLLDVAHGHHKLVKEAIGRIKNEVKGNYEIIAGSIATKDAAKDLCEWGVDGLRVGIGNGSLCETRIRTGVGIPQVTALLDICPVADQYNVPVIADGGVRNVGDVCKGLACGSDSVMLGSLLSGTKETPGDISKVGVWPNEQLFKKYRGSASLDSKQDRGENKNVEGNSKLIAYKGKVRRIVGDVVDGIKSSMSYVGANNLEEFSNLSEFVEVTQAGIIEAKPHLL